MRGRSSFCCGNPLTGHGSGIILGGSENKNNPKIWDIEGATALHVIGNYRFNWKALRFNRFSPNGDCYITQGQHENQNPITGLCTIIKDNFLIHEIKPHPLLDLCIFYAQCPKIVGRALSTTHVVEESPLSLLGKKVSIIHYPSSSQIQRFNVEILDNMDMNQEHLFYRVNTLKGSSGAPIFQRGSLCGIHIATDHISSDAVIEFSGLRFGVTNRNKGIFINADIINFLRGRPAISLI